MTPYNIQTAAFNGACIRNLSLKMAMLLQKWYLPFVSLFLFTGSSRPQFVGDLKNITVAIGREATFSCNVRNLVPFKVSSMKNGILLPKLFWPTVRKNCSSDRWKTFEIWGWRSRICKNFEITRTICSNSERPEQFMVTKCFFNLFLEVSQI